MAEIVISKVSEDEIGLLDSALRQLSEALGDTHRADIDGLKQAAFGPTPAIHAMIAQDKGQALGAVVFCPTYSTTLAAAGLFVSDLWVAENRRGTGLGRQLLGAAAGWANDLWQARYLKLAVYHNSPGARRFYDRLGFAAQTDQHSMILDENGLSTLKGCR